MRFKSLNQKIDLACGAHARNPQEKSKIYEQGMAPFASMTASILLEFECRGLRIHVDQLR